MYMAFCDMNLYVRVVRSTPDPLMTNKILYIYIYIYIYICQSLGAKAGQIHLIFLAKKECIYFPTSLIIS
jgi:hypothetical protein